MISIQRASAGRDSRLAAPVPASGAAEPANQSVSRALAVLDLVAAQGEMGVREISRQLALAPSITHRLVSTLAAGGYLEQSAATNRYRVGHQAFRVGSAFLEHGNIGSLTAPELARLAEQHHINGFLGVQRGREVVYLASVQSQSTVVITHAPGAVTHLHSTALGKALLAALPDEQAERVLGPPPFLRLTPRTITTWPTLQVEVRRIRRGGPAISDGENIETVYAAGAPLRDASGAIIAAISGAVPLHGMDTKAKSEIDALIMAAAERISRRLGAPERRTP